MAGLAVAAVAVVVLAVVLLVPRSAVLDGRSVEAGVTRVVGDELHYTVTDVHCPDRQPVRAGAGFACSATVDGTASRRIPVTVTDAAGNYDVGSPV